MRPWSQRTACTHTALSEVIEFLVHSSSSSYCVYLHATTVEGAQRGDIGSQLWSEIGELALLATPQ